MAVGDASLARMSRHDRANTTGYILSLAFPRLYGMRYQPPTLYLQPTFPKRIDATLNITVRNDAELIAGFVTQAQDSGTVGNASIVSLQSGLLIWLPQRGIDSAWRMGFVKGGTRCFAQAFSGAYQSGLIPPAQIQSALQFLTFTRTLAIPYVGQDQIDFAPPLEENFSKARVYTGAFEIVSNTTSIGNTALAGRMASGCVTDTRDISQNDGQAYAINDLVQTSMTAREGLKEVPVQCGIVSLLGPDARGDLDAPDANSRLITNGSYRRITVNPGFSQTVTDWVAEIPPNNPLLLNPMFSFFVSPYGVTATPGSPAPAPTWPHYNVTVPEIDENGQVEMSVNFNYNARITATAQDITYGARFRGVAQHYYAYATDQGYVNFNTAVDDQTQTFLLGPDPTLSASEGFRLSMSPWEFQGNMGVNGKYVGTMFVFAVQPRYLATVVPLTEGGSFIVEDIELTVRATSVDEPGRTGPAHIIRWDAVTGGQNLNINGELYAQCVPQGNIAPFTQNDALSSKHASNVSALSWASDMFNTSQFLSRNWRLDSYNRIRDSIEAATIEKRLLTWAKNSVTTLGGAEANGFAPLVALDLAEGAPAGAESGSIPYGSLVESGARAMEAIPGAPAGVSASGYYDSRADQRRGRAMQQDSMQSAGQWGSMAAGQWGGSSRR